jgi:hypothetical protein
VQLPIGGFPAAPTTFCHQERIERCSVRSVVSILVSTQGTEFSGSSGSAAAHLLHVQATSVLTPCALWPANSPLLCSNSEDCPHPSLRASSQPAPPCSMTLQSRARLCAWHGRLMMLPFRTHCSFCLPSSAAALLQQHLLLSPPPLYCSDMVMYCSRWRSPHALYTQHREDSPLPPRRSRFLGAGAGDRTAVAR